MKSNSIWIARSLLILPLLAALLLICQVSTGIYTGVIFATSFIGGGALSYLVRAAETNERELVTQNWQAARSAQEQIRDVLLRRGLGGNAPNIFDKSESLSQALASTFVLLISFGVGAVLTAGRIIGSLEGCVGITLNHVGFSGAELVTWIIFFASLILIIYNRRFK